MDINNHFKTKDPFYGYVWLQIDAIATSSRYTHWKLRLELRYLASLEDDEIRAKIKELISVPPKYEDDHGVVKKALVDDSSHEKTSISTAPVQDAVYKPPEASPPTTNSVSKDVEPSKVPESKTDISVESMPKKPKLWSELTKEEHSIEVEAMKQRSLQIRERDKALAQAGDAAAQERVLRRQKKDAERELENQALQARRKAEWDTIERMIDTIKKEKQDQRDHADKCANMLQECGEHITRARETVRDLKQLAKQGLDETAQD